MGAYLCGDRRTHVRLQEPGESLVGEQEGQNLWPERMSAMR